MREIVCLIALFCFSCAQSSYAERDVIVRNAATGEVRAVGGEVPESVYRGENWLLLDDFEDGNFKNYLKGDSGAWNLDPIDEDNAYADIEIVEVIGPEGTPTKALKVTYDVESDVKAENGFWTKLRIFDASEYDHLEFDVKCDEEVGCTSLFRIELKKFKDEDRTELIRGTRTVENVGVDWKHVELKLNKFTGIMDFGDPAVWQNPALGRKDLEEFVVVFKDRQVDQKVGAILFDNIRFTQKNDPGPTAVDSPARHFQKTPQTKIQIAGNPKLVTPEGEYLSEESLEKGNRVIVYRNDETTFETIFEVEPIEASLTLYQVTLEEEGDFVAGNLIFKSGSQIPEGTVILMEDRTTAPVNSLKAGDKIIGYDAGASRVYTVSAVKVGDSVDSHLNVGIRLEGFEFQKYLASRLRGYPETTIIKKTFPDDNEAFLRVLAEDTWKFFDNIVDAENHLPLDTVQFAKQAPLYEKDAWVGDYTNITNIGMYFFAIAGAHELGLITREDAIERARGTINTLDKLPRHESGFYFNYYDTTSLEQTSYFISSVDSGWLSAGLIVIRNAFPELFNEASAIIDTQDYSFFYDEIDQQLSHGYYQHLEIPSDYNYGAFYTEPRTTSFIGIGKGDIPVDLWFQSLRTFSEEYYWQTMEPINRVEKEALGVKYFGGFYRWKNHFYVPSWGGSLFEALMPTLVLDEKGLSPESLGQNALIHSSVHAEYAKEELGYPVWGMSPSSVPEGGYSEFGVKVLGSKGYKAGVVTPHVTGLALNFIPEEAISNFRKLIELYDIYGEYGFYDAVTVETGLVATKYLALDQGMLFGGLVNYLTDGSLIRYFMQDAIAQRAKELLTAENLFDPPYDPTKARSVVRRTP